ncbi:MAG: peptidylprolyl isomerase [Candidatus Marinimicrobia bacterium]|nr:peptidylprolyl isomerase [Candidatus Neomarinimicrobiota bacterium]
MKFRMCFLLFLALSFGSQAIITIDNVEISDSLFFEKYPEGEWTGYDDSHKLRVIDDFIRRKVYAREAMELKLHQNPETRIKISNQRDRLLVNFSYEEFVAKPLVTEQLLSLTKEFLKKEVVVHHILIGFDGSRLQKQVNRSIEESKTLALKIKEEFESGQEFEALALQYSDDKSVTSNNGKLGWIEWGQTVHDFQLAAFSLDINELSDPVLTDYGYHLIFISEVRDTGFNIDDPKSPKVVRQVARKCINSQLFKTAEVYDEKMISDNAVTFHDENLQSVLEDIEKTSKKNKITGNPNIDLQSVLSRSENLNIICVFDGKGFGAKWFAEKLAQSPASRRPIITDMESLKMAFRTIVLQEIALKNALEHHLGENLEFLSLFDDYETAILYDAFRKYIEDNTSDIDSTQVVQYYNTNKDRDYKEGSKVSIRELNVSTKSLADSLYGLFQSGTGFVYLTEMYGQINPEDGGLVEPFTEGKYDIMGQKAFSMSVGDVSPPFEKLNRSWSIIKLEEKLPESYKEIEKVYNKIYSILLREKKASDKDETFEGLKTKYQVSVNPSFFNYPVVTNNSQTTGSE